VCLGIAALLLIISRTGGLLFYRWRLAEEIAACRRAAEKFLSVNRDRRELIELQLAAFLPDSLSRYRQLEEKLQKSVKAQEWRRAAAAAGEQQKMLRSSAERLLPEIPKKSGSVKEDFKVAGAARGFLVTPLAAYLPGETLLRFKNALFPTWVGEVRTS
jgi:hypothetical protein